MNAVRLERFYPDRSISIYNHSLWFSSPNRHRLEKLANRQELMAAIHRHFQIPRKIIEQALAGLSRLATIHG